MQGLQVPVNDRSADEKEMDVPREHNRLLVTLEAHSWVSISVGDRELVRKESPEPVISFILDPGPYTVRTDGKIEKMTTEAAAAISSLVEQLQKGPQARLRIETDAPDEHPVDGIGEILADGKSFCTVTLEKVGFDGQRLTGEEHNDELFLRSTGGLLKDRSGNKRIRKLKLSSGKGQFRLVSERSPKVVTVTVFGEGPLPLREEIQIEFI